MGNNISINEAVSLLKSMDNVLILCHKNPDGDTIGSGFALKYAFDSIGKRARVACSDEFSDKYSFLVSECEDFTEEYVVAVDVADSALLGDKLAHYGDKVDLCIDHHISNNGYAKNLCLDADCASATQLLYKIIKAMTRVTSKMADCLYTGLCTDSGCFKYSNTSPETLRTAAELIECGADSYKINTIFFDTKSKAQIALESAVLGNLEYFFDGKVAVAKISRELIAELNAQDSDLDGLSSRTRQVEGVEIGITIREQKDGSFKISVRTSFFADASEICKNFGGGGHARAAGCSFIDCDINEAQNRLVDIIGKSFFGE